MSQNVRYQPNQIRLSRPVYEPNLDEIKFSAIQPKKKMKKIHVWTRLHSTGSHKGSSSVTKASTVKIIKSPRKYTIPSEFNFHKYL